MASLHAPENESSSDHDDQNIDLSYIGSRDDAADSRTVASRKRLRDQLSDEVQAFLAKGGKISQVDANVTADPPQRPISHYGQQPI